MNSAPLSCFAQQRPIGQGGFYSATLRLHGRDAYTFVYDCGSLTDSDRLSNEIQEFSRELGNRQLDLLVLSHLDADHVNGVDRLLRNTNGVRDVFLPYLSPLERLIFVVRYPNQDESYYRLVADPVSALRTLGAENVFLVGESDEDGSQDDLGPTNIGPDELDRLRSVEKLKLNSGLAGRDAQIKAAHEEEYPTGKSPMAEGVTDARSLDILGLWKLRMFQKQGLRSTLSKVLAAGNFATAPANETPDEKRCRKFLGEIQAILADQPLTNAAILAKISTDDGRKELRSAYEAIASIHNEVSLCLWHGPAFNSAHYFEGHAHGLSAASAFFARQSSRHYWPWWDSECPNQRAGTMLTGDLCLKGTTLTKFAKHYERELPISGLFQIPHHGSRHNIELDHGLIHSFRFGFTSAGLRNKYLHPHMDVVDRLYEDFDLDVLWSHEKAGVTFMLEFHWA